MDQFYRLHQVYPSYVEYAGNDNTTDRDFTVSIPQHGKVRVRMVGTGGSGGVGGRQVGTSWYPPVAGNNGRNSNFRSGGVLQMNLEARGATGGRVHPTVGAGAGGPKGNTETNAPDLDHSLTRTLGDDGLPGSNDGNWGGKGGDSVWGTGSAGGTPTATNSFNASWGAGSGGVWGGGGGGGAAYYDLTFVNGEWDYGNPFTLGVTLGGRAQGVNHALGASGHGGRSRIIIEWGA